MVSAPCNPGQFVRHREETEYDPYGQRSREWTNIIQVENAQGNIVATNRDNAVKTEFAYDERGNLVRTTFHDGSSVHVRYDSLGRQTAESQQVTAGISVAWSESARSFVVAGSNPLQPIPTKLYEYDNQGQLAAVELPEVPNPANGGQLTRPRYEYGYAERGSQTLIRDPLGRETRFTFDARGRQLTRTLPLGFGPDGRLGTADDATLPEGPFRERFEHDDRGRQTLHVSFEGVVTQFVYDSYGRVAEKRFFANEAQYNSGAGTPSETWTHKYDAFSRMVEVQNDGTTTRVTKTQYDSEGHTTVVDSPEGVIGYDYDNLGRKTATKVYAAGANPAVATPERITAYAFDPLGRLKTVVEDLDPSSTLDSPLSTAYAYDLRGNLDRTTLPNGVITDYVFDNLNRLDAMIDYAPDSTPNDLSNNPRLARYEYTDRADGKRTAATETFWVDSNNDGAAESHVNQFAWTYDNAGRLVDEVLDHFDSSLDQTEHFAYDLVGNRLSFSKDLGNNGSVDEAITYLVDGNDRLKTESLDTGNNGSFDQITTYGYDHTQQTNKTVADSASSAISAVSFSYDLQGRMSQVVTETFTGGSLTRRERVSYDYDASGIRVSSLLEIDADANGAYESSTRTEYLVDHRNSTGYQQVIKETVYNGSEQLAKIIEYTIGHDEIAQTTTEFDSAGNFVSSTTLVFGHDGHGSVRVLFNTAAALTQLFGFDAYGQLVSIHNGTAQFVSANAADALTSILYSGEQFDSRINQQYLRARWYDQATGRFNSLDPAFGNTNDPLSLHKYLYAHADPVNGLDPTGKIFISLLMATFWGHFSRSSKDGLDAAIKTRITLRLMWLAAALAEGFLIWGNEYQDWARNEDRLQTTGMGGINITTRLTRTADDLGTWWDGLTPEESYARWDEIHSMSGWDASPLNTGIEQQRGFFANGITNWAPRSVTVQGDVYYAHEVNYFFWGFMNAEAYKKGASVSEQGMVDWIRKYRRTAGALRYGWSEHDGTVAGREAWARAGWKYSMTRGRTDAGGNPMAPKFRPPIGYSLRNATPNSDDGGSMQPPRFTIQVGNGPDPYPLD